MAQDQANVSPGDSGGSAAATVLVIVVLLVLVLLVLWLSGVFTPQPSTNVAPTPTTTGALLGWVL